MWPFRSRAPEFAYDMDAHNAAVMESRVRLAEAQRFGREMERWPAPLTAWQNAQLGPLLPIVAPGRRVVEYTWSSTDRTLRARYAPEPRTGLWLDSAVMHTLLPPGMSRAHFEALAHAWGCTVDDAIRRYAPAGHWRP